MPVGFNPHGDPMTMQLVGREWADPEILGMGYALEQVTGPRPLTTTAPALRYEPGVTPRPIVIEVPAPPVDGPRRCRRRRRRAERPSAEKSRDQGRPSPSTATTSGGKVRFVLANRSAAKVTGTVTLRVKLGKRTVVLGRAKVAVGARGRKTLVVTLSRAARRALGGRARVSATATYALSNATGAKTTKTVKLAIRLR